MKANKSFGTGRENYRFKTKMAVSSKNKNTHTFHKTNKKEENTKQAGITLISLVVTIIVIIILASISVSTLYGENRNNNKRATPKTFSRVKLNTEKNRYGKVEEKYLFRFYK